jgi:hypothetical protein
MSDLLLNPTSPPPAGFALYGKGPLKAPAMTASPDVLYWSITLGEWIETTGQSGHGHFAIRLGSKIARKNGFGEEAA